MAQSLGKIAQAKWRKHKHTTFNCIHLVNDWLWSHPCKELVEYHQSQFHPQPHHECSQVTIASLLLLCQAWSQQSDQPPNLAFQQIEWTVTSSSPFLQHWSNSTPHCLAHANYMGPAGRPTVQFTIQTHQASPGVQIPLRSEILSSNGCHMQQFQPFDPTCCNHKDCNTTQQSHLWRHQTCTNNHLNALGSTMIAPFTKGAQSCVLLGVLLAPY